MRPLARILVLAALVPAVSGGLAAPAGAADDAPADDRLRVIIETDAGGDPDDEQSLVRFLLYTCEWDVEGIIATRPEARDGENRNVERTGLGIVRRQLAAYAECWRKLVQHDSRYPPPATLEARTVAGYDDVDDAVRLIIAAVDRDDPRPVWFANWGTDRGSAGSNLRRALDRVLAERGPEGYARFKGRLRLSSDDQFGDHTAKIAPPFKIWVDTFRPPVDGTRWYHRFSGLTAKAGGFDIQRDVLTGHGPLGALYPLNTTHPQKEGDTMSFLYLVPTGMNDPERPGEGSWAGRYGPREDHPGRPYYWAAEKDTWNGTTHRDNTLARFAAQLQNDFRARMDWCVRDKDDANHPPAPRLAGAATRDVRAGETVALDASASTDPDGDALAYEWTLYPEAGGWRGPLPEVRDARSARAAIVAPAVDAPAALHVLLTVTDAGEPPLTRYRRVVLRLAPATAEDWPGWRGPRGDGTSRERGVPVQWDGASGAGVAWKVAVPGVGHSSPIVAGERIFVTSAIEESGERALLCFRRADGGLAWRRAVVESPLETLHHLNSRASGTPAADERRVFAAFMVVDGRTTIPAPNVGDPRPITPGEMVVACYDHDGGRQWLRSVGPFISAHGFAACPVLFEDLVIVNGDHDGDAYIVALERDTGAERWRIDRENKTRSYSTPIIREMDGRVQMMLSGSKCVASYDPRTGSRHWIVDGPTEQFVASLVDDGTRVFVTGGYPERHILAIRPDGRGNVTDTHILWRASRGAAYVPSPVVEGPYFLIVSDTGIASCFRAATGETVWVERLEGGHSASLIAAAGLVYFLSDDGVATVVRPGPTFEAVARNALGERCFASPAVSGGRIFLRSEKHLWAIRGDEAK